MDYKKISLLKKRLNEIHLESTYYLIFYPSKKLTKQQNKRISLIIDILKNGRESTINTYFINTENQEKEIKSILNNLSSEVLLKIKNKKIVNIFPLDVKSMKEFIKKNEN